MSDRESKDNSEILSDTEPEDIRAFGPGLSTGKTHKKCKVNFTDHPLNNEYFVSN